ncbi:hypothetical protein HDU82_007557 [Entophlyctis luteolus]|nr:hypothetical protein HDU82_007557 [Entophlyctis luteolus]
MQFSSKWFIATFATYFVLRKKIKPWWTKLSRSPVFIVVALMLAVVIIHWALNLVLLSKTVKRFRPTLAKGPVDGNSNNNSSSAGSGFPDGDPAHGASWRGAFEKYLADVVVPVRTGSAEKKDSVAFWHRYVGGVLAFTARNGDYFHPLYLRDYGSLFHSVSTTATTTTTI